MWARACSEWDMQWDTAPVNFCKQLNLTPISLRAKYQQKVLLSYILEIFYSPAENVGIFVGLQVQAVKTLVQLSCTRLELNYIKNMRVNL